MCFCLIVLLYNEFSVLRIIPPKPVKSEGRTICPPPLTVIILARYGADNELPQTPDDFTSGISCLTVNPVFHSTMLISLFHKLLRSISCIILPDFCEIIHFF